MASHLETQAAWKVWQQARRHIWSSSWKSSWQMTQPDWRTVEAGVGSKVDQTDRGVPRSARACACACACACARVHHTHTNTHTRLLEGCEEVGLLGGAGEDEQHVVGPVGLAVVARHLRVGEAVQVGHLAACLRRVAAVRVEQLEHRAVDKRSRGVLPRLRRASEQELEGVGESR